MLKKTQHFKPLSRSARRFIVVRESCAKISLKEAGVGGGGQIGIVDLSERSCFSSLFLSMARNDTASGNELSSARAFDRGRSEAGPGKLRRAPLKKPRCLEDTNVLLLYSAGHELVELSGLVRQREKQVVSTRVASSSRLSFFPCTCFRVSFLYRQLPLRVLCGSLSRTARHRVSPYCFFNFTAKTGPMLVPY